MKAVILSAGKNNEISDIVGDIPKNLIKIHDSSILENQINILHLCGIDDISVVKGYKEELFDIPGLKYYMNEDYLNTGILYSLFCAEEEFDDELIIIYGDTVFSKECLKRIIDSKYDLSIGVNVKLENYKYDRLSSLELVYFNSNNVAIQIGKKMNDENEAYGQFTGIIKCSKKGSQILHNNYKYFKQYNKNYKKALISDLLYNIIQLGILIGCTIIERGFTKIDSKKDYYKLLNESEDVINIKTNWEKRAQLYENIKWVNIDDTLEAMLKLTDIKTSCPKILDIGVGTGKVLKYFKKNLPESECYGIDISSDMINKIDKSYEFNLQVGNAENLEMFSDDFFDIIVARMSMHHVENLEKAMKEIKRVLKHNGNFIICEGVPPNKETLEFYEEVFKYKENRNTFLSDDLINLMCNNNLEDITTKTIILKDMSMNNWLVNAAIPYRNKDIICNLHYNCNDSIKKAYKMKVTEDDILMEWKFLAVRGKKRIS